MEIKIDDGHLLCHANTEQNWFEDINHCTNINYIIITINSDRNVSSHAKQERGKNLH